MSIEVRKVVSQRDLKKFVMFPFFHYKNNRYWIPPMIKGEMETLSPDKNPAFDYCEANYWLAYKDGRIAGRIAGIFNTKYIKKWGKKYASFSRPEFVDDPEVSGALFGTVEEWAKSKGMKGLHGPLGFSTFDQQAILIEGFEELPTTASVYNYPYYQEHMEKLGYSKEVDYVEYRIRVPESVPEKAARVAAVVQRREKVKVVKSRSKKDLAPYAKQVFDVINAAYAPLFYFTELTEKQVEDFTKKYFSFILAEYVTLIVDSDDKMVAFQITMPSLSEAFQKARGRLYPFGFIHLMKALKRPKVLDVYLVGILPEYQGKGVNALLMLDLTQIAIDKKIEFGESNSELEENVKVQSFWKYYDARRHKRKRVYLREFE